MKALRLCEALFLLFLLGMNSVEADLFTIGDRTGTCSLTTVCDLLQTEINKELPDADPSNYLQGIADSSVMAQKGMGIDYSNGMDYMLFGASLGAGADLGNTSTTDLLSGDVDADQIAGFAAGASLIIGVNGGLMSKSLERFNFFINYLSFDWSKDDISGDAQSIGLHVNGKIIKGGSVGFGAVGWSGLNLATGVEFASSKLNLVQAINQTVTIEGQTGSFVGTASINTDVKTTSIPFEVFSGFNLFNTHIYGGLGADVSFGSAEGGVNLLGDVTITGGTGVGSLDIGSKKSPESFMLRSFVGAQIDVTALQLFANLNKGITNDTLGVTFGLRVGF